MLYSGIQASSLSEYQRASTLAGLGMYRKKELDLKNK